LGKKIVLARQLDNKKIKLYTSIRKEKILNVKGKPFVRMGPLHHVGCRALRYSNSNDFEKSEDKTIGPCTQRGAWVASCHQIYKFIDEVSPIHGMLDRVFLLI